MTFIQLTDDQNILLTYNYYELGEEKILGQRRELNQVHACHSQPVHPLSYHS